MKTGAMNRSHTLSLFSVTHAHAGVNDERQVVRLLSKAIFRSAVRFIAGEALTLSTEATLSPLLNTRSLVMFQVSNELSSRIYNVVDNKSTFNYNKKINPAETGGSRTPAS